MKGESGRITVTGNPGNMPPARGSLSETPKAPRSVAADNRESRNLADRLKSAIGNPGFVPAGSRHPFGSPDSFLPDGGILSEKHF